MSSLQQKVTHHEAPEIRTWTFLWGPHSAYHVQLETLCKKIRKLPSPLTKYKINSRWAITLHVRVWKIKLLEENRRTSSWYCGSEGFHDQNTPTKKHLRLRNWSRLKLRIFHQDLKIMKMQATEWEKVQATHSISEGLSQTLGSPESRTWEKGLIQELPGICRVC